MSTALRPFRGGAAAGLGQLPWARLGVAMERSASEPGRNPRLFGGENVGKTWEHHGKMMGTCLEMEVCWFIFTMLYLP